MSLTTEEREQLTEGFRKELAGLQAKLDAQAVEKLELASLAQLRADECRARGKELLEFGECTEALVRQLWPGEEAERILESDVCGETRALFARIGERVAMVSGDRRIPVDHAAETLAQLECMLLLPVGTGGPETMAYGERWGRVAGRIAALLERVRGAEHSQDELDTLGVMRHELARVFRARAYGHEAAATRLRGAHQVELDAHAIGKNEGRAEAYRAAAEQIERGGAREVASIPVEALNTFLKRHTSKAEAEAEPLRSAQLGMVQELAALMVRHTAPAAAGLLGGTALVDEQLEAMREGEPLNPGEVAECGAQRPGSVVADSYATSCCARPAGHDGRHLTPSGAEWEG